MTHSSKPAGAASFIIKLRSTRICKPRAPLRLQSNSNQTISGPRRRSSRLQSRQRSVSIPHILGSQSPLEQRPTDTQPSQLVRATSYTRVPTSSPIEVSAPVPSRTQFQEYPCLSQIHNHQTRKRRSDRSVETGAERPPKRARLTEKNLEAFEKMRGRQRKSAREKSTRQSTTTTTTDKDFSTKLQQNNIIYTTFNARAPDDIDGVRELLDQPRESEPPKLLDYQRYLVVTRDYENELGVEISAYPLLTKRTSREVEISGYF
ncbi:hypothetical protein BJ875DRAFT_446303 [Amylocarpus encephaloides]|uniref:Uncharacterized protein n=1 Tax=Amylocarpus encephaloides TaxID=45428 RepID=A0A9P7Y9R8_9HELO|nr:hypothetical protein BJ875DRAFT_446303 [Amylocarpus encephaloides]